MSRRPTTEKIKNPKTTILRRIVGTTTTGKKEEERKEKGNATLSEKMRK